MSKRIRLGLLGCNMYRTRDLLLGAEAAAPGVVKVTACYDILKEKAEEVARRFGGRPCASEAELLASPDVDVVLICLPPHLHAGAFARTAAAGKDVYLEKPVCVNPEGRALLLETVRKHPVRCYVGLSYRFIHPFLKVAELVRRPDAGKLLAIHVHWMNSHLCTPVPPEKWNWRHRFEQGGGQLVNHCCHLLDWFRFTAGDAESVQATATLDPNGYLPQEERELTACYTMKTGGYATINMSLQSHQWNVIGFVTTENLGIQFEWAPHSTVRVFRNRPRAADEVYEWADCDPAGDPLTNNRDALQMAEFIDAWLNRKPMPCSLADGIVSYDMACAARESYRTGRRTPIPAPLEKLCLHR